MRTSLRRLSTALLLLAGIGAGPAEAQSASQPVARVGDHEILAADLDRALGNRLLQLRTQQFLLSRAALDRLVDDYLLQEEARRQKLTVAQMNERIVASASMVTAKELQLVFEATRDRYPAMTEEEALKRIEASVRERRILARRRELAQELRAKYPVRVLIEPPRVSVSEAGAPSRGPADAVVTLIEFSDYQCPFCAKLAPAIEQLLARFPRDVRFVHRDFPLANHVYASAAAETAHCAGDQGQFWAMHERLTANFNRITPQLFPKLAKEIGLDEEVFKQCLDSGRHAEKWQHGQRDGLAYGVTGTPALFLNGRYFNGLVPIDVLTEAVKEEIAAATKKRTGTGSQR